MNLVSRQNVVVKRSQQKRRDKNVAKTKMSQVVIYRRSRRCGSQFRFSFGRRYD